MGGDELTLFDHDDVVRAAPSGPLVRVRLTIAYDGSGFRGMAANPGVRTVAGVLGHALERVLRHPVRLSVAGRTDAGVHARGQVVSFDARAGVDPAALARAVNAMCAPAIVVREAALAPPDFDARFSARSRVYRYQVLERDVPDPFLAATTWHVPGPLDAAALALACDPLIGEHDFSSFCRRPRDANRRDEPVSLVRHVRSACWTRHPAEPDVWQFWIEADSFCHQMVRSIVGTLVEVGRGRRSAGQITGILRARDRAAAGPVAPPHGLCLWEVRYGPADEGGPGASHHVGVGRS